MQGRHEGNYNTYLEQRDREFIKAYRKATEKLLKEKGSFTLIEALNMARNSPTTRYFVTEQRAEEVIRSLDKYYDETRKQKKAKELSVHVNPLQTFNYEKQRMYSHLYIEYTRIRQLNPYVPFNEAVLMACSTPANEFYITLLSAKTIHGRIMTNMKKYGIMTSRNPHRIQRDLDKKKGQLR